jgi:ribosomal protein S12 methylthiotransferase accessory factor
VDCSPAVAGEGVKAIVPGLESETMSYHRIGWRGVRRLRERGDTLLLDGPHEGALRVRLRPEDEARCGGPALVRRGAGGRMVGGLYPLYRRAALLRAAAAARRGAA